MPVGIALVLLSALAALYLGGILNPTTNLRHFPIAVVNEDAGPMGAQIVEGLTTGIDNDKFDLRILNADDAERQLDTAQIYGSIHIGREFSEQMQTFGSSALQPGQAQRPVVTISTNPRAGSMGASIAGQTLSRAMTAVNDTAGQHLWAQVAQLGGGEALPAGVSLALAQPIDVHTETHNPLPNGTGNGLSAFYYSLLLLLAGFTGSMVVSSMVDSMLGYLPAEFGPVFEFADQANMSRLHTLIVKWALMAVLAVTASAAYLGIAALLGMVIPQPWKLWLFGAYAITAVGVTATSLIATIGSMGVLANLLFFVILGLPSAGAAMPLQAAPPIFTWLATFEPMHQVFLGTRSLLYLDGRADAGLSHALQMTSIGLAAGILIGAAATHIYDRRGYHRFPGTFAALRASRDSARTT